ncbi:MAG TPA: universal stress protein [Longilinea sp.]|nr:universal stress protein [Longilinea sp.]
MIKRILVPLDGSKLAENVLPFACSMAKQLQATLVLFHVVEKAAPDEIHGQHHLHEVGEARAYLDQVTKRLSSDKLSVVQDVHEVQEVGVAQTISNHADELHTDLIILCAHGNGGLRDVFYGNIAQQVIRQSKVPVLFIRPDTTFDWCSRPIAKIMLLLDGAKAHEVAIPVARDLAESYHAELCLLNVVPDSDSLALREAITGRVSPRATALTLDIGAKQAESYLDTKVQELSEQGISAKEIVLRGEVISKLIETIAAEKVDLVVMATHGHNVLDAHWEGSLTPRFLPKADVPVLLVRGVGADRE